MRTLIRIFVLILAAALSASALAQTGAWPAKNIQMVVGFPAGGIVDVMTRVLAQKMSETLGVQVIVIPTPGAGGTLAMQKVAQAAPDGYTLMMIPTGTLLARPHQMGLSVSFRDFTPVVNAATASNTLSVKLDHRWKTFGDFVKDAKENPGKYTYSSPAVGGIPHLGTESAAAASGVKLVHVPYPGGPQAIAAAVGGQTDLVAGDNANPQIRALATMNPERSPYAPEVPTLRELGIDVEMPSRYSIVGPRGLPPEVVRRVETAVEAALKTPEVQKNYAVQQLIVHYETGEQLAQVWPRDEARFKQVIDRLGLSHEQQKKDWKN